MNKVNIELKDFPRTDSENPFEITGTVFKQIYLFYKNQPLENTYFINLDNYSNQDSYIMDYIRTNDLQIYAKYGISIDFNPLPKKILKPLIIDNDTFTNGSFIERLKELTEQFRNVDIEDKPFIVIEVPLTKQESYFRRCTPEKQDIIREFYKNCNVANSWLDQDFYKNVREEIKKSKFYTKLEQIDFFKLLYDNDCLKVTDINYTISKLKEFVDYIENTYNSKDVLFYFDIHSNVREYITTDVKIIHDRFYLPLAAYLSLKHSYKFYVSNSNMTVFRSYASSFFNREHNHMSDYINMLLNPIKVGVHYADSGAHSICQINKIHKDIIVDMLEVYFNNDELQIKGAPIINNRLGTFKTMNINNFYNMDTDNYDEAAFELKRLNNFLFKANKLLQSKNNDIVVDCSNSFICSINDRLFLCYVKFLNVKYEYQMKSLTDVDFKRTVTFDIKEMESLVDLRLFPDYQLLGDKLCEIVNSVQLPKTSDGILANIPIGNGTKGILADSGLSFDALGLWSPISRQFRGDKVFNFTKYIPSLGIKKSFLTYYGGPHAFNYGGNQVLYLTPDMFEKENDT